jgi:transcriptional regulator with XRE-family HTH domain
LATLRALRSRAGLTQGELAAKLGRSQNFVTALERGVTRLDGLQLRDWCLACGTDFVTWATAIEDGLAPPRQTRGLDEGRWAAASPGLMT